LAAAAIDDYTNAGNFSTIRTHNINGFLDPSAASDDVLGDDKPLVRPDLKTAPQGEPAGFFLDKGIPIAISIRGASDCDVAINESSGC